MSWPIGIVDELFPSSDGLIRSVRVKTSKGALCRPIQKLHDLEINHCCTLPNEVEVKAEAELDSPPVCIDQISPTEVPESPLEDTPQVRTRRGRVVKPPAILDL